MTLKRRIAVFLIAGLVIAGVVAVYYMPQWQQTQAASKGGRRGGPAAVTDPVPQGCIGRRSGRSDHRHGEAEGGISQRRS
jgi:hypothetical protein